MPPPLTAEEERTNATETGMLLDTLGSVLQFYGKYSFETDAQSADETRTLSSAWTRHATMGAPRPGHEDERPGARLLYRDWKGLVQFFAEHRRNEGQYVTRSMDDLRAVIWEFVSAVHHVVVDEQEVGRVAGQQLERVKEAVEGNSVELIKREAMAAVSVMAATVESRRKRHQEQFARLADKLKNLGRELEEARRESTQDSLTGLANRKAFDGFITRSIELHSLLGEPASLMMIDVDRFKTVNDSRGHPAGDAVLRQVSLALSKTFLRRCDFVCRYGGDEFAVILQETDLAISSGIAERLRTAIRDMAKPADGDDEPEPITVSIGVAQLNTADDAEAWIRRADAALYEAKAAGRDRIAGA